MDEVYSLMLEKVSHDWTKYFRCTNEKSPSLSIYGVTCLKCGWVEPPTITNILSKRGITEVRYPYPGWEIPVNHWKECHKDLATLFTLQNM